MSELARKLDDVLGQTTRRKGRPSKLHKNTAIGACRRGAEGAVEIRCLRKHNRSRVPSYQSMVACGKLPKGFQEKQASHLQS